MSIPRIVVVGGGAGGLELATRLGNKMGKKGRAEVHLVDRNTTHLWKPLLHEVAAGSLDSRIDEISYRSHAHFHHFEFHRGSVQSVDRAKRMITLAPTFDLNGDQILPERFVEYDYLVLAVGSQTNDFGTPGAKQHCAFLDSREQADRFHRLLLDTYLRLNSRSGDGESPVLNVGIVGAGATGVELSAELHNTTALLRAYGLNLGSDNLKVTIIEAGPRILTALSERMSSSVVEELNRLNVNVMTGVRVVEVTEKGFRIGDGSFIESDLKVWAAGVKAPEFLAKIEGMVVGPTGQLEVQPTLQCINDPKIFVIGDCASCIQPDGSKVPPRAQSAHQMATHVYKNIDCLMRELPLRDYVYKDHGSLVSLSHYSTVGSLMGNLSGKSMMIEGRIARFVYISLYRMHQIALHGYFRTALIMFSSRINRIIRPKLKLH